MRRTLTLLTATAALAASVMGTSGAALAAPAPSSPGPFYWVVNVNSGKVLMPYGESKATGEVLVQHTKGNLGAEHWKILGSGTTRVLWNRNSHLCVLAPTGTTSWLTQQYCDDTSGDPFGNRPKWNSSNYDAMWAGNPVTWRSAFSGQCMDVYEASLAENVPVEQWPCHGGTNQQFRLEYVPGT